MQLATDLSIVVVAEGVETEEQRQILMGYDCDYLQGYLFSRPVTTESIEKMLERQWYPESSHSGTQKTKRAYFRIEFPFPLEAQMTVSELNGKKIEISKANVLVKNIGPGGLLFVSNITLPANANLVVQLEMDLLQEHYIFHGTIVHVTTDDGLNFFGIKFKVTEAERSKYIKLFNHMQLMLNKSAVLPNHSFILEKMGTYFKK